MFSYCMTLIVNYIKKLWLLNFSQIKISSQYQKKGNKGNLKMFTVNIFSKCPHFRPWTSTNLVCSKKSKSHLTCGGCHFPQIAQTQERDTRMQRKTNPPMKYVITFISLRRATPEVVLRSLCLCVAEFALGKHQVSRGKKNSFGKHSAVTVSLRASPSHTTTPQCQQLTERFGPRSIFNFRSKAFNELPGCWGWCETAGCRKLSSAMTANSGEIRYSEVVELNERRQEGVNCKNEIWLSEKF